MTFAVSAVGVLVAAVVATLVMRDSKPAAPTAAATETAVADLAG